MDPACEPRELTMRVFSGVDSGTRIQLGRLEWGLRWGERGGGAESGPTPRKTQPTSKHIGSRETSCLAAYQGTGCSFQGDLGPYLTASAGEQKKLRGRVWLGERPSPPPGGESDVVWSDLYGTHVAPAAPRIGQN